MRREGIQEGEDICMPMPIHVYVQQKPSQYCKVIILQLKFKKEGKKNPLLFLEVYVTSFCLLVSIWFSLSNMLFNFLSVWRHYG